MNPTEFLNYRKNTWQVTKVKIFLISAAIFILLLIIASFVCFLYCFTRKIKTRDMSTESGVKLVKMEKFKDIIFPAIQKSKELPQEEIFIQSYDGLKLHAVLYEAENADTTLILFHGWISSGLNDFCCIIPYYAEKGYNVLLVSQRGQGKSGGKYICMGTQEKFDCVSWCEYINKRFGEEHNIFIEGISMGASTVLFASALKLPDNVRGIIADCGFTSPIDIIKSVAWSKHIFPYPLVWMVALWFRIFCGRSMYKDSTLDAMKKNKQPILFLHGESDGFVPCRMGKATYEACTSDKQLILVPGAGHGQCYLVDTERCTQELDKFIEKYSITSD